MSVFVSVWQREVSCVCECVPVCVRQRWAVCVCMCLCVCVDEKHFSCDTLFGTSYGIFHSFYMFDILAKPVRRGSQIGELQYLAFNNYCQYNS